MGCWLNLDSLQFEGKSIHAFGNRPPLYQPLICPWVESFQYKLIRKADWSSIPLLSDFWDSWECSPTFNQENNCARIQFVGIFIAMMQYFNPFLSEAVFWLMTNDMVYPFKSPPLHLGMTSPSLLKDLKSLHSSEGVSETFLTSPMGTKSSVNGKNSSALALNSWS